MINFLYTFFTIASLHFLGLVTPGPDFALVTNNALLYPRREAIFTALGIAVGISVHVTYCILGLALVIASSHVIFNIIKYLGAAYLIYLGIKIWLPHKNQSIEAKEGAKPSPTLSAWKAFKEGLLCNLLNPKATLFILGLFTLVIKPTTPWWERTFYGGWMVLSTFLWFAFISYAMTHPQVRAKVLHIQPIALKVMGVLLVLFGLELALWQHH